MFILLHYLYRKIPGICILPLSVKDIFLRHLAITEMHIISLDDPIIDLQKLLENELRHVQNFFMKNAEDPGDLSLLISDQNKIKDYKMFRLQLADLEAESDALFAKINQLHNILKTNEEKFELSMDVDF